MRSHPGSPSCISMSLCHFVLVLKVMMENEIFDIIAMHYGSEISLPRGDLLMVTLS